MTGIEAEPGENDKCGGQPEMYENGGGVRT